MKLIYKILVYVNVAIIAAMVVTGYCDRLNPVTWGWMAEGGFAFPFFLLFNLVAMVFWTLVKLRYVLIPVVGMLICYGPIMLYTPVNRPSDTPEDCIRVLSYNTCYMGDGYDVPHDKTVSDARKQMFQMFADNKADIVCLQEAFYNDAIDKEMNEVLGSRLPYRDTIINAPENTTVMLMSQYPIKKKEKIEIISKGNVCGAFTIDMNGKDVLVCNLHLETNAFSAEEKDNFKDVIKGNQGKKAIAHESKFVIQKLAHAAKIRAPQAQCVASFLRMHAGVPVILCGDFNDIPISYAHRTIAKDLTDCYVATALGPGYTFCHHGMRVRIDNIMCSEHFTPYGCRVIDDIFVSDHYPIFCSLKLKD